MDGRYQNYHNNYAHYRPAGSTIIKSELNGQNEVPANNSSATGELVGLLCPDGTRLDYALHTHGLHNIISAHFHIGVAGQNGRIVKTININPATGTAIGSWTINDSEPLTRDLMYHLKAGSLYVNVHTVQLPDGEIRGQTHDVSNRQYQC